MENFIREQNIRLFRAKLAETMDATERAELQRLLAVEEAKPVALPADPAELLNSRRGE